MPDHAEAAGRSTVPILTLADGRATVRLNRPREHNRIEPSDLATLQEIFARIDADRSIRVLVLTGTGKSFSSGYHLGALADRLAGKGSETEDRDTFEHTVDRLEALRVPTIAALNGSVMVERPIWPSPATFASGLRECGCRCRRLASASSTMGAASGAM